MSLAVALMLAGVGCASTPSTASRHEVPGVGQAQPVQHSLTHPHQLPPRTEVPMLARGEHLFVRAGIDGHDAGYFLLDTGAALDAVDLGIAGRLKLPELGDGVALGIAGLEAFTYRQVGQLSVGPLGLPPQRLAGLNLHRVSQNVGQPINGIVGFSSLKRAPFTLDYQRQTLSIYQPQGFTPPTDAQMIPLRIARGLPLITARIGQGPRVWLIIDTGADNEITLPRTLLDRFPHIAAVRASSAGSATGLGGRVTKHQTWLKSMNLLGVELKQVPVSFEELPTDRAGDTVGRIGHKLLRHFRLTFDPRGRRLYAQWQPAGPETPDGSRVVQRP